MATTIKGLRKHYGQINRQLRKAGIKPPHTIDENIDLRRRRETASFINQPIPIKHRLHNTLIKRYESEIINRGGEVEIEADKSHSNICLSIADRNNGLTLLRADGWRYYSRRFGSRPASIVYLCGRDDSGDWAVRVARTCKTVNEALEWITPAAVHNALLKGKQVIRQGDVYAIETTRAHDGSGDLPDSHKWNSHTRMLYHSEHTPTHIPYPCRFVRQRVYKPGRSGLRTYGD